MNRYLKRESGFTVIELMMVIAIIAVVAVTAYPRLENLPETRANFAVEKMRSDFRYAQQLAISTQRASRIVVNPASNNYQIQLETSAGSGTFTIVAHPVDGGNFLVTFDSGQYEDVVISSVSDGVLGGSMFTVDFDLYGAPSWSDGSPLTAGNHVVLNGTYTLQFRPETGNMVIS